MTIQVVPLRRSVHPGCNGDCTILTYEGGGGGGGATVYSELLASSVMTNDQHEVAVYQAAMKSLNAETALSVEDSARLLGELAA